LEKDRAKERKALLMLDSGTSIFRKLEWYLRSVAKESCRSVRSMVFVLRQRSDVMTISRKVENGICTSGEQGLLLEHKGTSARGYEREPRLFAEYASGKYRG
jgi:hypothetical protein